MKIITEEELNKIDALANDVVDLAFKLARDTGPGLLESTYLHMFSWLIEKAGYKVVFEKQVTFEYEGKKFSEGLRVDLLIDDILIVELKSVEKLSPVHYKQTLTYARILELPVALLINFGAATMSGNFSRIVNERISFSFDFPLWAKNHRGYNLQKF